MTRFASPYPMGVVPTADNPDGLPTQLPTIGSANAYKAQPLSPQAQLFSAQRQQQLADALLSQSGSYIPNSGVAGSIAMMAQALVGKKLNRKADESVADALKRQFEQDNAAKAAEQQRKAAEDQAKFQREQEAALKLKAAPGYEAPPTSAREYALASQDPAYAAFLEKQSKAKGTNVSVSVPGQSYAKPFDEALAKADVGMLDTARQAAMDARRAQFNADKLAGILDKVPSGKPAEFYGKMAQYFGAPAGADYQAQKALVEDQVNAILNAAKGPQTDQDAERARAQIPNMGTDPRARKIIFDYIRQKNENRANEYKSMETYARQHGNLQGYELPAPPAPAAAPAKFSVGQIINHNGKKYRVTGGDLSADPDVQEIP